MNYRCSELLKFPTLLNQRSRSFAKDHQCGDLGHPKDQENQCSSDLGDLDQRSLIFPSSVEYCSILGCLIITIPSYIAKTAVMVVDVAVSLHFFAAQSSAHVAEGQTDMRSYA